MQGKLFRYTYVYVGFPDFSFSIKERNRLISFNFFNIYIFIYITTIIEEKKQYKFFIHKCIKMHTFIGRD